MTMKKWWDWTQTRWQDDNGHVNGSGTQVNKPLENTYQWNSRLYHQPSRRCKPINADHRWLLAQTIDVTSTLTRPMPTVADCIPNCCCSCTFCSQCFAHHSLSDSYHGWSWHWEWLVVVSSWSSSTLMIWNDHGHQSEGSWLRSNQGNQADQTGKHGKWCWLVMNHDSWWLTSMIKHS